MATPITRVYPTLPSAVNMRTEDVARNLESLSLAATTADTQLPATFTSRRKLLRIVPRPRKHGLFPIIPARPDKAAPPSKTFRPISVETLSIDDIGRRYVSSTAVGSTLLMTTREELPDVTDNAEHVQLSEQVAEPEPLILHPEPSMLSSRSTATPKTPLPSEPCEPTEPLPLFNYKEPLSGETAPSVVYTTSASEADSLILSLQGNVLGLDLEWPLPGQGPVRSRTASNGMVSYFRSGVWDPSLQKYTWPEGRTSVIQLCDGHTVVIFHLLGDTQPGPGLVALLSNASRIKVGVGIRNDALKLVRDFPAFGASPPAGILELSKVARAVEPRRWTHRGAMVALAKLCQAYLHRDLDKGHVRTSAWDSKLTQHQIDYAANDVVVSYLLHGALVNRAESLGNPVNTRGMAVSVLGRQGRPAPKPTPEETSELSAYTRFVEGHHVSAIAASLGMRETVVMSHVLNIARSLPITTLDVAVRERMLQSIARGTWVATKYSGYLSRVKKSLESGEP